MPYLLLVIGLIFGIYALYRFFMSADIQQIKSLILAAMTMAVCAALFLMALTGRLPAAIALISALSPFIIAWYAKRKARRNASAAEGASAPPKPMNRHEALDILGLKDGASEDEIKTAYKTLMKKVHPDAQGSGWMAEKLNEAKDFLLKK